MSRFKINVIYLRAQFYRQSFYRFNTVMSVAGAFLAAMVQFFIWQSVANVSTSIGKTEDISAYAIMATAYVLLIPTTGVARRISNQVLKGTVSYQLLRPVTFFNLNFWTQLGSTCFSLLTTALPLTIMYIWIFKIRIVFTSVTTLILVIVSMLLGYLIAYQLGFIVGLFSFQTVRVGGFISLYEGIMTFFGGAVLPISIYPQILQKIVAVTPFYAIQYLPLRGLTTAEVTISDLMIQLFWIICLTPLVHWYYGFSIRKIDVVGG